MHHWTDEQEHIFTVAADPKNTLIKISAVAGASKSTTLAEIAKRTQSNKQLYLIFSKTMAEEAKLKFPYKTDCKTIHALAYKYVVIPGNFKIGQELKLKDINEPKLETEKKLSIIRLLDDYLLSKHITVVDYLVATLGNYKHSSAFIEYQKLLQKYLNKMMSHELPCTHSFYLKLFHIGLHNGNIVLPDLDLLMVDEAQDLTELTIEVTKLLTAKQKIIVGDPDQAIFGFMKCVNAFDVFKNEGIECHLSKSFRVDKEIATRVDNFLTRYLNPHAEFKGMTYTKPVTNGTLAFISRTNATLVGKIIELDKAGTEYNLVREAKKIFELPLILLNLHKQTPILNQQYKFLEQDVKDYYTSRRLQETYKSIISYISSTYSEDMQLKSACSLVLTNKATDIYKAYNNAKQHEDTAKYPITIMTAHSSKGLTVDNVVLADDMNTFIEKIIENYSGYKEIYKYITQEEREALNLYYVACTRCRHSLTNAKYL